RCYLQLRPQSTQAALVRGQLDVAKREFIRTMPGNLLGKDLDKVELIEQVRYLTQENDSLKRQLQGLQVEARRESRPVAPAPVVDTATTSATVPPVRTPPPV